MQKRIINEKWNRRFLSLFIAVTLLFGLSIAAIAAGGNAGLLPNYAGTGFQLRLTDPDTTMSNEGGTYVLEKTYNADEEIVFTFSLNPQGGQKGFGVYPNGSFSAINIYDKNDAEKKPVVSLGGNYSQETINENFYFTVDTDPGYPDHLVFVNANPQTFGNERISQLKIAPKVLQNNKTYCLSIPKSIQTYNNGSSRQFGADVTIEFRTRDGSSAHQHIEEAIPAVEPTCTETGLTEGKKCSECGDVLVAQETVPAKGHTEEVVKGKAATCTEKGLTDGKKCSVCNAVLEEQKEIPAKGHTEEVLPGKEATCTETGLTEGKKCSVCDAVLEEQKEIPALGHDFKDGKCTRCDAADPDYKPTSVEPDTKFTGLANKAAADGNWYYYTDGKIDTNHTGVDQNKYGWWRVENGKVNFKAQGIYQNQYGWWKTTDGKVTFKENSIYQNEFGWWKCKDSKVDFTAQSIYQNQYGWWKTTNGKVTFKENGLFKNQYGTWKVENSKVNFNYNGTYQGKTIKNGKVQ